MSVYQIKTHIQINDKQNELVVRTRGDGIYLWILRNGKEKFVGEIKQHSLDDLLNVLPAMKSKYTGCI